MHEPLPGNGKRCSDPSGNRLSITLPGEPPRPAKLLTKDERESKTGSRGGKPGHLIIPSEAYFTKPPPNLFP